jgi:RNA polymerase sigma-70 factor (ECF subfamily)
MSRNEIGVGAELEGGEDALVDALRAGDEGAFASLIDRYYDLMLRVARMHVATREAAEDVVQETFLGVIEGIDRFEARSSLRTWMFRILTNLAKSRGEREGRSRPFSSVSAELGSHEASVDPDRLIASGRWAGYWATPPVGHNVPEVRVLAAEAGGRLISAIEALPPAQRTVIILRDVKELSAAEVCALLGVSESNQRVLLHRARSKIRAALEHYLDERVEVS